MPDRPAAAPVAARKAELRARLIGARRSLSPQVRGDAADRVRAALADRVRPGGTVAGYVPIGSEPGGPDLPGALARMLGPSGRLLLPVLRDDKDLDWVAYPAGGPARSATAPPGRRLGTAAIREAGLVVVPALAVDRDGIRLGRGGGSYDRALARVPEGTEVVALLHDGELLDDPLPADPHDRRVTAVIAPGLGLVCLPA